MLLVTFQAVGAVVVVSGLLGVPAAYALARRQFPGKRLVMLAEGTHHMMLERNREALFRAVQSFLDEGCE